MSTSPPTAPEGAASSSPIRFDLVALDTDDPAGLARFYCDLLGWEVEEGDERWVTIRPSRGQGPGAAARLAFQLDPDHVPPTWPERGVPQQLHLDFDVDSLEEAGAFAESVGARRVRGPGMEQSFWVYLDPSGHPFCLCVGD